MGVCDKLQDFKFSNFVCSNSQDKDIFKINFLDKKCWESYRARKFRKLEPLSTDEQIKRQIDRISRICSNFEQILVRYAARQDHADKISDITTVTVQNFVKRSDFQQYLKNSKKLMDVRDILNNV